MRVIPGGTYLKASSTDVPSEEEVRYGRSSGAEETQYVGSSEGCILGEEEVPCVGYLASTEYLCNNSDCSTEGDGTPKTMTGYDPQGH